MGGPLAVLRREDGVIRTFLSYGGAVLRAGSAGSWCALLVLVVGLGLSLTPQHAAAESSDTVTTVLEPGLNLVGWTEAEASIEAIFEDIPRLELVYAWDAGIQAFRWAAPTDAGVLGTLHMLSPGMGLWLAIAGAQPVSWTRPVFRQATVSSLREGWNLVAWAGEDGATATDALRDLDDILTASADAGGREPTWMTRGGALWLNVSAPRQWEQQSTSPVASDPTDADLTIGFLTPVSAEREAEVRALINEVVEYFDGKGAGRVPGLTISWGDPEEVGCSGHYYYTENTIRMADCTDIFPHEYVHAIQDHLNNDDVYVPQWFSEGSADLWAAIYHDHVGRISYTYELREIVLPLGRLEGFIRGGLAFGLFHSWHARLHLMARMYGADIVFDFYRRLSTAGSWLEAFRQTMGMTILEFNIKFAEYALDSPLPRDGCPIAPLRPDRERSDRPPEVCTRIEGTITDLAGNPRPGINVRAGPDLHRIGGLTTARTETGADGTFSLVVPEGRHGLALNRDFGFSYYGGATGLVDLPSQASFLHARGADILDVTISSGLVAGTVLGRDGEPVGHMLVYVRESDTGRIVGGWGSTTGDPWAGGGANHGKFGQLVPRGTYEIEVVCASGGAGWYGGETGLVPTKADARAVVIDPEDATDIVINLLATEEEVRNGDCGFGGNN